MGDRWMDDRDRDWRDRDRRRTETAYGRGGEHRMRPDEVRRRTESRGYGAERSFDPYDEDYGSRSRVASGGDLYPGERGYGGRPGYGGAGEATGFTSQDYTGRYGRGSGERLRAEGQRWEDDRRYADERRGRDWDERDDRSRDDAPGDFLQRAGERISSWFRGRDDRDEPARYRSDIGQGRRPLHRGAGPRGYMRSDERISDEVHDRLTDDSWIDASEIDVAVKDGEVTLSGHVDNREAKHRAERLIEDLSGVRHVQNNLRVNPSAPLTQAGRGYGSSALEAELRRNAAATDPGNNGVSGLSGRTSTGAAAERSTTTKPT